MPCDSSCSTCSESSKCTTCANNLYQYGGDNLCKHCHKTSLNPAIITQQMQNCAQIIQKCLLNPETQIYELTSICQKCKGNFVLANNKCINQCSDIAQNYEYNNILQQCQCSSSSPYQHNQPNNNIFCYKFQLPGYYCDSNKICNPCLQPHCQVCTNQAPYNDELKTISLQIDPPKLIQNRDYTIVSQQQSDNNLMFQVSVQQNIKISQIVINYNNKQSIYQVQNTILTSDYVNRPLIVFKAQLPQPLYTGALLGASFIFTEIPSPDELSINSNTTSNEDIDNHKKLLQQLGFKDNIYQNLALPHLLLIISVIISLLCLFARQVMEVYTTHQNTHLKNSMQQCNQQFMLYLLF
ncbi:transmembrane protein, putative (macronuclear) [Tetrahymena thermophila SB210]|uniref:Transmembrane protein, putative n=1 Tax=Tetrahymena thermophila (strain SB210) TaxID=312017 RepID=Q234N7_TETTS|nr:transmembrane protein, putative [Tetrahymena thermophila SB210]EAR91966.3 transmembrane protein, putative [Tetrahymena thermophila SB210]|eukprot:XP_001012211.3 transmembrane protein, putative [Tetrahymena thermophila SB210]